MTAQVLIHPVLRERLLAERIEDMRREANHAEQWWIDLHDGTRDYSEWNPALRGHAGCGPQELAADEAYIAWQDTLAQLRALEAQAGGAA